MKYNRLLCNLRFENLCAFAAIETMLFILCGCLISCGTHRVSGILPNSRFTTAHGGIVSNVRVRIGNVSHDSGTIGAHQISTSYEISNIY